MATITALNGAKLADAVYRFESKVEDYALAIFQKYITSFTYQEA